MLCWAALCCCVIAIKTDQLCYAGQRCAVVLLSPRLISCAVLCCAMMPLSSELGCVEVLLAPSLFGCTSRQSSDSFGWLQAENQAIDRVHRIGQEHDVTVHRLYMAGNYHQYYNHYSLSSPSSLLLLLWLLLLLQVMSTLGSLHTWTLYSKQCPADCGCCVCHAAFLPRNVTAHVFCEVLV